SPLLWIVYPMDRRFDRGAYGSALATMSFGPGNEPSAIHGQYGPRVLRKSKRSLAPLSPPTPGRPKKLDVIIHLLNGVCCLPKAVDRTQPAQPPLPGSRAHQSMIPKSGYRFSEKITLQR